MLLVIDIGNTNLTLGIYEKNNLLEIFRMESNKSFCIENYAKEFVEKFAGFSITKIMVGSVVDELNETIKQACIKAFGITPYLFSQNSKTGVEIDTAKPQSVGADRIANAYASIKLYKAPCVIIDSGSATTFDIISSERKFFGGIIMPGIQMQFDSLNEKTSKLPRLVAKDIKNVIGIDTETSMLSGVIRGHACAIDGLLSQVEKELGEKPTVIATGGLSELIAKYMTKKFDYINPSLTLDGFRLLYELNN